jgi:hypothetical protein
MKFSLVNATTSTRCALKLLTDADERSQASLWRLLRSWLPNSPSAEESCRILFEFFYVPLRWRCEFLQKIDIPDDDWASYEITGRREQTASWQHVKDYVFRAHLSPEQRAPRNARSVTGLIINRLSKSTHACKVIITHGLARPRQLLLALHALAANLDEPDRPNGRDRGLAQLASESAEAQLRLRLRSRSRRSYRARE